ncbi:DUF3289 family protein [Brenneria goodwinii]|uniref:DUF3289 family protein n=1 Tax=Brenneria goodwinii TaxID=1109412 RepID=UPI0036E7E947
MSDIVIFTTKRKFNDFSAPDMRYGDLSLSELKNRFNLVNISNVIDPYTMQRMTIFNSPQSRFAGVYGNQNQGKALTSLEASSLLFNEMRNTSWPYSWYGINRNLINRMLTHMQRSNGLAFTDVDLNRSYKNQIINDNTKGSTRLKIIELINKYLNLETKSLSPESIPKFANEISALILPKFDAYIDRINGLGITIHDMYATQIAIRSLLVDGNQWKATLLYTAQDHFGLDDNDISKLKFKQIQFFKIWFFLQRYKEFAFRPFLTNMEATIDIEGYIQ